MNPQMPPGPGWPAPGYPQPPVAQAPTAPPMAPPSMGPPPPGPFARAERRTPFPVLVKVELRKFTGTLSDRILLVLGPVALVLVTWLIHSVADYESAGKQIAPTFYALRVGPVLLHAALIKLIAGEWQHRSAQPTLLVQPSRTRYFLAQATVVLMVWMCCAGLQIGGTLLFAPGGAAADGSTYLLGHRVGWVVGVCLLGSFLTIMVALTVGMLVPNAAGALAIYFVTVPVMMSLNGLAPKVFVWFDPSGPTAALATLAPVEGPGPVVVSLLLWVGLLGLAGYRVARRDLA